MQYPTMSYNQIVISLVDNYKVAKILYKYQNFSEFKKELNKIKFTNRRTIRQYKIIR